jgi:uncharacterized damage-inducible protein DinB
MTSVPSNFIQTSVDQLQKEYLPRLQKALDLISEDQVWWRPHPDTTSIGNLLVHLAGNVRQWIVSGLGGQADFRQRATEFARTEGGTKAELLAALSATVEEACDVIESLDDAALLKRFAIQGFEPTGLEAVYHVVEHFGWHTGQIVWIAKMQAGSNHGLAFYDNQQLNAPR